MKKKNKNRRKKKDVDDDLDFLDEVVAMNKKDLEEHEKSIVDKQQQDEDLAD